MHRRLILAGLSAVVYAASSVATLAAPCGPAVLSKADGKVLVNRGVGFIDGKAGMPLAVGDHVMLRSGSAEVLFVNGTGSALTGSKSMAITACAADASLLTSPALAQFGTLGAAPPVAPLTPAPTFTPYQGISPTESSWLPVLGVTTLAIVPVAIIATNASKSGSSSSVVSIVPLSP